MSFYKHVREAWKNPKENMPEVWKERLIEWRRQPAIVDVDNPTRIDKARAQGYKAKNGFNVVRGRIRRGGRKRKDPKAGRRPKRAGQNKYSTGKSLQQIVEERVSDKYPNLEVLNSYSVAEDANHKWFEVILVDPEHPEIQADDDINWITESQHRGRAERGKTKAGKKGRGQAKKGRGSEKSRPSKASNDNRAN